MFAQAAYFPGNVAEALPEVRAAFIRKVYAYFFATVVVAVLAGALVASSESALAGMYRARGILGIFELVMVAILAFSRRQTGFNTFVLFLFAAATGATITPVVYLLNQSTPGVGMQAAVLTVSVFGGLSWYALFTRKDFSFLGGFLFGALFALLGVGLLFIFIHPSNMAVIAYSAIGTLVFCAYVLYDTSRLLYRYGPGDVIPAVTDLYLDIINLFLFILRLLASSQRRD